MSKVFKHLPDPRETLAEIRRILKPNGMLLSTSLNPESYLHKKHGQHRRGLEIPRHLYLFSLGAKKAFADRWYLHGSKPSRRSVPSTLWNTHRPRLGANDRPGLPSLPASSQLEPRGVFAATLAGRGIGEWMVVIRSKPAQRQLQLPACLTDAALV
jgi:2-polyprenyl-3-methyl-5-hydroxy-6-metoxy-1,4-benzoquinol methylase